MNEKFSKVGEKEVIRAIASEFVNQFNPKLWGKINV